MARDGLETDPKPMGDLLGGVSFADQTEDSQFSKRRNALGRFFHTSALVPYAKRVAGRYKRL